MLDFFTKSVSKLFGTKSDRDLKEIQPVLDKILAEFPKYASLSNDQLRGKTSELKKRIADFVSKEQAEIDSIRTKIDTDLTVEVDEKEKLYGQIDELEKTIVKKN